MAEHYLDYLNLRSRLKSKVDTLKIRLQDHGALPQWSYDSKTNYGYLALSENVTAYTVETQDPRVLLDMAEDGTIVGIEVSCV